MSAELFVAGVLTGVFVLLVVYGMAAVFGPLPKGGYPSGSTPTDEIVSPPDALRPHPKGVRVIHTRGFPDDYVPPSASLESPADVSGISMEMREQKLGRVEVTQLDAAEPPPDMSEFKMTTIRDPGSAGAMIAFAVLVVVVLILVLVWS